MDIIVGLFVLAAAVWALGMWQTNGAKQQVSLATGMSAEEAARIVHDSFGRVGWRQVPGKGLLNYQARLPLNGPVLSVDLLEVPNRQGVEMAVWMSAWQSRYGIASGAPVASRQRRKILRAFDPVAIESSLGASGSVPDATVMTNPNLYRGMAAASSVTAEVESRWQPGVPTAPACPACSRCDTPTRFGRFCEMCGQPAATTLDAMALADPRAGYQPVGAPPTQPHTPQQFYPSLLSPLSPSRATPPRDRPSGVGRVQMVLMVVAAAAVLLAAVAVLLNQAPGSQVPVALPTASGAASGVRPTSHPATPTVTAADSLPAGSWITVLESLPKNEFSQEQAGAKAASLSVAGRLVSVIDSDAIPGLNSGFWALGVPGSSSRQAAVALCAAFGRQAGGSCYPRQVG